MLRTVGLSYSRTPMAVTSDSRRSVTEKTEVRERKRSQRKNIPGTEVVAPEESSNLSGKGGKASAKGAAAQGNYLEVVANKKSNLSPTPSIKSNRPLPKGGNDNDNETETVSKSTN